MQEKLWSVVFLKTTGRATAVVKVDENGSRTVSSLPDNTPPRGVYAGEYMYTMPEGEDSEADRKMRGFYMIAAKAAQKIGIKDHGGIALYAYEKARLLEVVPL